MAFPNFTFSLDFSILCTNEKAKNKSQGCFAAVVLVYILTIVYGAELRTIPDDY